MNEKLTIEQTLDKYGFIIHKVQGVSMLPLLNEDTDLVRLVPVKGKLKKYDLPLYRSPQGTHYILHRILEVKKNYYLICGDNNTFYEKVTFDRVVAVAEGFYKEGKYTPCDDPDYLNYVYERCKEPIKKRTVYKKPIRISAEQHLLLKMLRCAILDIPYTEKSEKINWIQFFHLANKQEIAALLYPYVKNTDCPTELLIKWKQLADMALRKEILFDAERNAIFAELEKAKIKYLPLKGIIIKDFYPHKGMRQFTDNDILFDVARRNELIAIMKSRNYEFEPGAAHDVFTKKPVYEFEFHKMLFVRDNPLYKHFSDVWENATQESESAYAYQMNREDFYCYTIAHAYKHFSTGGIGVRFLADLFLMKREWKDALNFDVIRQKLTKAKLIEFHDFSANCAEKLFEGEEITIQEENIGQFLFGGMFGLLERSVSKKISEKGRIGYLRDRIFIPYDQMRSTYPILYKLPILLPFCWLAKVFNVLFTKSKLDRFKTELKLLFRKNISDDD